MTEGIWTTESLVAVVQNALFEASECMPRYAHPLLGKDFTEHQLYSIQVLRRFLKTDIHGVIEKLGDSTELYEALGLEAIPDYASLLQAETRLVRKGFLEEF